MLFNAAIVCARAPSVHLQLAHCYCRHMLACYAAMLKYVKFEDKAELTNIFLYVSIFFPCFFFLCIRTVRPRDTRPQAVRTSQVHVFELGPKLFEMHVFARFCTFLHVFARFFD